MVLDVLDVVLNVELDGLDEGVPLQPGMDVHQWLLVLRRLDQDAQLRLHSLPRRYR